MGWERRRRKHECELPTVLQAWRKQAEVGDIWKCRKCKTRWELTHKGIYSETRAGPMHENTWRRRVSQDHEAVDPPRKTGTDWLYTE